MIKFWFIFTGGGRGGENEGEVRGRSRAARRDDPRRHTLGGDQQYGLMSGQGGPLSRTMDLEVTEKNRFFLFPC